MKFTEQEWIHIEDLKSLDDKQTALLKKGISRDAPECVALNDEFYRQLMDNFPFLDDDIWVLIEVFPDMVEDDELIVREVLEDVTNASVKASEL